MVATILIGAGHFRRVTESNSGFSTGGGAEARRVRGIVTRLGVAPGLVSRGCSVSGAAARSHAARTFVGSCGGGHASLNAAARSPAVAYRSLGSGAQALSS